MNRPIDIDREARRAQRSSAAAPADWREELMFDIPLEPALWQVFVAPLKPRTTSEGGIEIVTSAQDVEEISTTVGLVRAAGPQALVGATAGGVPLAPLTDQVRTREDLIGKFVMYEKHGGESLYLKSGHRVVVVTASQIKGVTNDPHAWRFYL